MFVFLVALILGPILQIQRAEQQVNIVELTDGDVVYDYQWVDGKLDQQAIEPGPQWLKSIASKHAFIKPSYVNAELPRKHQIVLDAVGSFEQLNRLDLKLINDPNLDTSVLSGLSELKVLHLDTKLKRKKAVPVEQLKFIAELSELEELEIGMSNQELPNLDKLVNLRSLRLRGVIDSPEIEKLKSLRSFKCGGIPRL